MSTSSRSRKRETPPSPVIRWIKGVRPVIFGVVLILAVTIILVFNFLPVAQLTFEEGDVAPESPGRMGNHPLQTPTIVVGKVFGSGKGDRLARGQIDHLFNIANGAKASANDTLTLTQAYKILGVNKGSSEAEIKKAYRRLMSQHHPDKLVAKGLPDEMIALATEKTQEIRKAYDLIKASL